MRNVRFGIGMAVAATLVSCEPVIEPLADTTLEVPAPSFAVVGPVDQQVTGNAHFHRVSRAFGEYWHVATFTARRYADGSVHGVYNTRYTGTGEGFKGTITCFAITGNRAWLGVEVVRPLGLPGGHLRAIQVVDNGQGGNAPPDQSTGNVRLSRVPGGFQSLQEYCDARPELEDFLYDLEAGNIQIRP